MSEIMKSKKDQENIVKYIGLVKNGLIVWDVFISIMDSLTSSFAKLRQLNEILLGELKTYLQIAKSSDDITNQINFEFEGANEKNQPQP